MFFSWNKIKMDLKSIDISNLTQSQLTDLISNDTNDDLLKIDGIFDVKPIDSPNPFYYLYIITRLYIPPALDEWMKKNNISRSDCIDDILENGTLSRFSRQALLDVKAGNEPRHVRSAGPKKHYKHGRHGILLKY